MCLKMVDVALKYSPNTKVYKGIGYKYIPENMLCYTGSKYRTNRWMDADLFNDNGDPRREYANNTSYSPGFHIFLNKEDAMKYPMSPNGNVWRVEFTDVLAFGTNDVSIGSPCPCIVTQRMKLVECLGKIKVTWNNDKVLNKRSIVANKAIS